MTNTLQEAIKVMQIDGMRFARLLDFFQEFIDKMYTSSTKAVNISSIHYINVQCIQIHNGKRLYYILMMKVIYRYKYMRKKMINSSNRMFTS